MPIDQKITTQLYPITGLTLEPSTPEDAARLRGDIQPSLAILAGLGTTGLVVAEITDDGAVKTADTGSGLTAVEVSAGTAADAATDLALSTPFTKIDIDVTDFSIDLAFEYANGSYSSDLILTVGHWMFDISAVDVRLNNTVGGGAADGVYKVWAWS